MRNLKAPAAEWRRWYDFLAGDEEWFSVLGLKAAGQDLWRWRFMNAGYADLDEATDERASVVDQGDALSMRLYQHLLEGVETVGRDIVEVGSGRGGGCLHIAARSGARSVVGVDLSERAVAFCNRNYDTPTLRFVVGDAERLPMEDKSADILLNVESSHCYDDMSAFVREAARVLRPGGRLLLADFRPRELVPELRARCAERFAITKEADITAHIVRALELRWRHPLTAVLAKAFDSPLALARWRETAGPHVSASMGEQVGTDVFFFLRDSRSHELFTLGEWRYVSYQLAKE